MRLHRDVEGVARRGAGLLRWAVRGDELLLREGGAAVRLRLGGGSVPTCRALVMPVRLLPRAGGLALRGQRGGELALLPLGERGRAPAAAPGRAGRLSPRAAGQRRRR